MPAHRTPCRACSAAHAGLERVSRLQLALSNSPCRVGLHASRGGRRLGPRLPDERLCIAWHLQQSAAAPVRLHRASTCTARLSSFFIYSWASANVKHNNTLGTRQPSCSRPLCVQMSALAGSPLGAGQPHSRDTAHSCSSCPFLVPNPEHRGQSEGPKHGLSPDGRIVSWRSLGSGSATGHGKHLRAPFACVSSSAVSSRHCTRPPNPRPIP